MANRESGGLLALCLVAECVPKYDYDYAHEHEVREARGVKTRITYAHEQTRAGALLRWDAVKPNMTHAE